jgi:hypothetical protein
LETSIRPPTERRTARDGRGEKVENIDPVYFLGPVAVVALSFGLVAYWRWRRRLTGWVILFSVVAYFGAIGTKVVFQALTYGPVNMAASGSPWVLGPYFGLQTVFLEVGFAYLFARYAVTHGFLRANDAEGYGISLALWENGVLVGGLALIEYVAYYLILSGSGPAAQQTFATLSQDAPSLFYSASSALSLVGYSILERVSSLLLHFSWGYLCVLAAVYNKRVFLLAALPMGLVDALVPFANSMGTGAFEGVVFAIGLASVAVALGLTRGEYRRASTSFGSPPPEEGSAHLGALVSTNFRRALSFGKIYVGIGMVLPLLLIAELSVAGSAATEAGTAGGPLLSQLFPLLLPVFTVLGASGALMIFASDREKGVYEYMLAYGVDVSTIFWSMIAATAALAGLVLVVSLAVSLSVLAFTNPGALTLVFGELVVLYTLPLSFAAAMFMTMAGMLWSQLTVRRPGVNSPVGIAPLLGIAPVLAVLILAVGPGSGHILYVVGGASVAMIIAVAAMASVAGGRMQRERFLSNG